MEYYIGNFRNLQKTHVKGVREEAMQKARCNNYMSRWPHRVQLLIVRNTCRTTTIFSQLNIFICINYIIKMTDKNSMFSYLQFQFSDQLTKPGVFPDKKSFLFQLFERETIRGHKPIFHMTAISWYGHRLTYIHVGVSSW